MSVINRHVKFCKDQFNIKQDILDQKIKVEKLVLNSLFLYSMFDLGICFMVR